MVDVAVVVRCAGEVYQVSRIIHEGDFFGSGCEGGGIVGVPCVVEPVRGVIVSEAHLDVSAVDGSFVRGEEEGDTGVEVVP